MSLVTISIFLVCPHFRSSMSDFLPFALPDIGEEEIAEVADSMRSGWLTTGPKAKRFEQDFAEFVGQQAAAIAVNSATAGLHLALEALGIGPGDEVIVPAYTFTATAAVARYLGAHPVLVDSDPTSFNINPAKIEAAITSQTKAIIPVHFGGVACDMDSILAIARAHGLKVVEDAAHALPTTYHGKLIGTLETDATVYSFYATKTITTGEGGMVVTRNPDIAKRCQAMRLHGISRAAFDRYTSTQASWYYEIIAPGFKYNMTDLAAAIGLHQLKKAWKFQQQRAAIAQYYDAEFANLPLILPPKPDGTDVNSWHLYVIQLTDEATISRNEFIDRMRKRGIGCSVHYIPLHLHPYWRETYDLQPEDFPCALATYDRAISLPIYTKMTATAIERVTQTVKEILQP